MTTTVTVPGGAVGAISISEDRLRPHPCIGQIATVHVRDGADVRRRTWNGRSMIIGSVAGINKGVITHTLDDGTAVDADSRRHAARRCVTNCIVSDVSRTATSTTIVFRTDDERAGQG